MITNPRKLRLRWRDDRTLEIDGEEFRLTNDPAELRAASVDQESFVLGKTRAMVSALIDHAPESVRHMVELGIFKGGSVVLYHQLFHPTSLICVDRVPEPVVPLEAYVQKNGLDNSIHRLYGTLQTDRAALEHAMRMHVAEGQLDLVIDDASHQYEDSRHSFEILFPRVRPGGVYVIEDWGWAHWPSGSWQSSESPFAGARYLSNLVMEFAMLQQSQPGLIDRIVLESEAMYVVRGNAPMGADPFLLSTSYLRRGLPFIPMGDADA